MCCEGTAAGSIDQHHLWPGESNRASPPPPPPRRLHHHSYTTTTAAPSLPPPRAPPPLVTPPAGHTRASGGRYTMAGNTISSHTAKSGDSSPARVPDPAAPPITSNSPCISHFQGVVHYSHHTLHHAPGLARRLRHIFATRPSILGVKSVREAAERCTTKPLTRVCGAEQGTVAGCCCSLPTQPFFMPYFSFPGPPTSLRPDQTHSLIFRGPNA